MGPRCVKINKEGLEESISFSQLIPVSESQSAKLAEITGEYLGAKVKDEISEALSKLEETTYTGNLTRGMLFFFVDKKGADKYLSRATELITGAGQDMKNIKVDRDDSMDDEQGYMLVLRSKKPFDGQKDVESKLRDAYLGFMREIKELSLQEGYDGAKEPIGEETYCDKTEIKFVMGSRKEQDEMFDNLTRLFINAEMTDVVQVEKEVNFGTAGYRCTIELQQLSDSRNDWIEFKFFDQGEAISFYDALLSVFKGDMDYLSGQVEVSREVRWADMEEEHYVKIYKGRELRDVVETADLTPTTSPFSSDNE